MNDEASPDGGDPVLEVENLTVRFRTRGPGRAVVHAVTDVSFEIAPGETLGLIGESGSGKSTVARAVSQLLRGERVSVTGSVKLDGKRLDTLGRRQLRAHRHLMQMIFQDPNDSLDPRMTVRQSIEQPARILRKSEGLDLAATIDAALDVVGLAKAMGDRRPHELSGGQRQRVNIARALSVEPRLLLCDEVVSALQRLVLAFYSHTRRCTCLCGCLHLQTCRHRLKTAGCGVTPYPTTDRNLNCTVAPCWMHGCTHI